MAIRKIVRIDEELCDGCGLCVPACEEGALQMIDGKAKLVGDILCDGFGSCLGECPQGAITIEEREAPDFDEAAVEKHLSTMKPQPEPIPVAPAPNPMPGAHAGGGCPGSALRQFNNNEPLNQPVTDQPKEPSQLGQWPIQLMLVPPHAPFLKGSDMLICADCVPFAVPDFHTRYLTNRSVLVGCPKPDDLQHYYEKLQEIFVEAKPTRITVLKMEVPCCNGIAQAAVQAAKSVNMQTPVEVHTIGVRGGVACENI